MGKELRLRRTLRLATGVLYLGVVSMMPRDDWMVLVLLLLKRMTLTEGF